jgi:ABC-type nickel/cobalt efflux system permease component RcnA
MAVSALCGLGHVLSSVVLGFLGVGLGLAVGHLEKVESTRGTIAAWLLIGFGLVYLVWGLRKAYRAKPHTHFHYHADGEAHVHLHSHEEGHLHILEEKEKENITPWCCFDICLRAMRAADSAGHVSGCSHRRVGFMVTAAFGHGHHTDHGDHYCPDQLGLISLNWASWKDILMLWPGSHLYFRPAVHLGAYKKGRDTLSLFFSQVTY